MSGSDCVRVVADEILKGQILALSEPLSYSGIVIVPIVRVDEPQHVRRKLSRTTLTEYVHKVIVGSLPKNTCGVFVLDSLGDVVAFKLHLDVSTFWERISFVEKLVVEHYKETRKPIGKDRSDSSLRGLKESCLLNRTILLCRERIWLVSSVKALTFSKLQRQSCMRRVVRHIRCLSPEYSILVED
ncbi:MAG: hypothetical protein ACXACG_15950 [Candidatus Thorarchaeota archaeon]|jgi:hypothetical protein